ncbi:MarR family transcriptional regulator [Microbulbifer sp. VAAF005]|uniref:MarR family winged helix-turn-helix transcriptional regulator n=1 Tax=Microbulbifer sp. VAAF005 TaxID=3034230 RepID=UPI0024AE194E|nr:MarR family transcriptional regulator [Microbulbifer sp. VAAF005]WHI44632.1 MarR family transcriptional regulator [Microbulbifer sp. VAAF005]
MFFLKELPSQQMVEGYSKRFSVKDPAAVQGALTMMRDASLLLRELESYFSEHGTSQLRFLVMIVIDREPQRDTLLASEIAERIDVSRPVMTRTLKSMVEDELIVMEADSSDGRAKCVALTKSGKQFLQKILPRYFKTISKFMEELNK